jgi:signal-transduction protein with cAMP-binding, CBS, and nucleotidyltransferase domain
MNTEAFPYPHARHLTIAGCLALVALTTAVIYAFRSTPYTMVLFLGGGSILLLAAGFLFGWTIWQDLRARLDSIVTKEFAPGQVIYRPGDPAEHVYFVTRGQVEAIYPDPAKGDIVLGRFGRDDFFGETAILSHVPRQVAARAVNAVELLVIHRRDFLQVYANLPRVRARIEAEQTRRKALMEQVAANGQVK